MSFFWLIAFFSPLLSQHALPREVAFSRGRWATLEAGEALVRNRRSHPTTYQ